MNLAEKQESAKLAEVNLLEYGSDADIANWFSINARNPASSEKISNDISYMKTIGMTHTEILAALNDKYMGSATEFSVAGLQGKSLIILLSVTALFTLLITFLNRKKRKKS